MGESVHAKLDRVRTPRVHITYSVETGGAILMKELPFVMTVLGDFTSNSKEAAKKLRERDFVEVNQQNIDDVLSDMAPRMTFAVPNQLQTDVPVKDRKELGVDITIKSMQDFAPDAVARQVPALNEILTLRNRLAELRGTLDGNDNLDAILQETINNTATMARLREQRTASGGSNG